MAKGPHNYKPKPRPRTRAKVRFRTKGGAARARARQPVTVRYEGAILSVPTDKLEALGYPTYTAYLASDHWAAVKRAYRNAGRPTDCLCGVPGLDLHHLTYEHLGAELDALHTLRLLCRDCHAKTHGL